MDAGVVSKGYVDARSRTMSLGDCFDGAGATIAASDYKDMRGVILINDAVMDTCADCGTFYSPNARALADDLISENIKLDPLGALADIVPVPRSND
jgi:hypothetical protein